MCDDESNRRTDPVALVTSAGRLLLLPAQGDLPARLPELCAGPGLVSGCAREHLGGEVFNVRVVPVEAQGRVRAARIVGRRPGAWTFDGLRLLELDLTPSALQRAGLSPGPARYLLGAVVADDQPLTRLLGPRANA